MAAYLLTVALMTVIVISITSKIKFKTRIFIFGIFAAFILFLSYFLIKNFDEPAEGSKLISKEEIGLWNAQKQSIKE